jgi:hypothetical protein
VAAEASVAANVGTVAELGITHERAKKIQRYPDASTTCIGSLLDSDKMEEL